MTAKDFQLIKGYIEQLLRVGTSQKGIQSLTGVTEWELKGFMKVISPEKKMEFPDEGEGE